MPSDFKRRSRLTTEGMGRAPNRAMLRAVGFLDDDFERPMIGVASLFSDITPCNAHLDRLAQKGCEGVRAGGGVPQIFGAPTASDGIMMGHQGMRYSLVSREVIADSLEVVAGGMNHDGLLAFGGCDKNMPGCVMAMARLNVPSVFVYGGSILPGVGPDGEDVDIVSIFEAVGRYQAGTLDQNKLHAIECESRPGGRVPHLADLKPGGKYVMHDLYLAGGTPPVLRALLDAGLLHGECMTVTGATLADNLKD